MSTRDAQVYHLTGLLVLPTCILHVEGLLVMLAVMRVWLS